MRYVLNVLVLILIGITLAIIASLSYTLANPMIPRSGDARLQKMARGIDEEVRDADRSDDVIELLLPAWQSDVVTRVTLVTLSPGASTRLPIHSHDAEVWVLTGNPSVVIRAAPGSGAGAARPHEVIHAKAGRSLTVRAGDITRVTAGTGGASILIVSRHGLSPLGGPVADHSQFDPGVGVQTFDLPTDVIDRGGIRVTNLDGTVEMTHVTTADFIDIPLNGHSSND